MSERDPLRGGVAVITGAASGIGAGLARHAAGIGMPLALADVSAVELRALTEELRAVGVPVLAHVIDVSVADAVDEFARAVRAEYGTVRLLFNNAGVDLHGRLWEITPVQWNQSVGVNLNGIYHGIRSFVPAMIEAAQPANIVNVASVGALSIRPYMAPYMATKHACLALTECLDQELRHATPHVRASAVLPGAVRTKIIASSKRADADGPGAEQQRRLISDLDEQGIDPLDAAEIIFDGVRRGELWIHTHPEVSDGRIRLRAETLLGRRRPALSD